MPNRVIYSVYQYVHRQLYYMQVISPHIRTYIYQHFACSKLMAMCVKFSYCSNNAVTLLNAEKCLKIDLK